MKLNDKQSLYLLKSSRSVFLDRLDFGSQVKLTNQTPQKGKLYKNQQALDLTLYSIGPKEPINIEIDVTIPVFFTKKNETILGGISACKMLIKGSLEKIKEKLFFLKINDSSIKQNNMGQYEIKFSLTGKDAIAYIETTFLRDALLKWTFWELRNNSD